MKRLLVLTLFFSAAVFAAEESASETNDSTVRVKQPLGMTITGNQELPNVLYIVPWKKAQGANISPIQGRIVDEVYGPLEANVFQRQIKLYRDLQALEQSSKDETSPE